MAEGLDFSFYGILLLVGDYPIRQHIIYEKDFGWMAFWELDLEELRSLWLMACTARGGITLDEVLHDWGMQTMPLLELYPGICLATEENHGKPQSG
jgi:hypothetical protein